MTFGGVEVMRTAVHTTADGRRFLVTHGDDYDIVVRHVRWLAYLGDWAYTTAIAANTVFNIVRRRLGFPYWSFSAWAKLKVKNAVNFIGDFEQVVAQDAAKHAVDGVVCGHIHHAAMRDIDGVTYVNTGDFVESCSFVAEHQDGTLEVMRWLTLAAAGAVEGDRDADRGLDIGEEGAEVISKCVEENLADYQYLKQFAIKV